MQDLPGDLEMYFTNALQGHIHPYIEKDMAQFLELSSSDYFRLKGIAKEKKSNNKDWYTEVVRLTSGESFGEKALNSNEPRAATITTLQNCYLAVIERNDYKQGLMRIEQRA